MRNPLRRLVLALVVLVLGGCAAVPRPVSPPVTSPAQAGPPPYEAWARVLAKHVDDRGRVDFAGAGRDRAALDRFVAYVYDVSPATDPALFPTPNHVLAYHLNAYNALAMHKVIQVGIPETFAGLRKVGFFLFGPVQVGGQRISLYAYENDVIRKIPEPRMHMALNCMSIGCPRLPREPFWPEKLDVQLDQETRFFFSEPRNLVVDAAGKTVRVSEILKFFPEDFLRVAPSIIAFINRYVATPIPADYQVEYIPYDWTVNRQPPR